MRIASGFESATLRRAVAILLAAVVMIALGSTAYADPFSRSLKNRKAPSRSTIARPGHPSTEAVDCPSCDPIDSLQVKNFSRPDRIDGPWLPLIPGTELILQGVANRGGGLLPHTVKFTVTNLRKKIGGIPCVVVYDRDVNEGDLQESELSFWAQDDFGNVWNTAEYPEEYQQGILIGAENTWVHGLEAAQAGVHIVRRPQVGTPGYREGFAPENDFWDCGEVFALSKSASQNGDDDDDRGRGKDHGKGKGHDDRNGKGKGDGDDHRKGDGDDDADRDSTVCVPAGCYKKWAVIREWAPFDGCDVIQVKTYARNVGIVQVGAIDDPEGETLTLASVRTLTAAELAVEDSAALAQDTRGYTVNDKYQATEPAYLVKPSKHHDDDDDSAQIAQVEGARLAPFQTAMRIGPNPVTSGTTIDYSVARAGVVELSIYDVAGRQLKSLVRDSKTPGVYRVNWDARDDAGRALSAGIYFAKLRTPEQTIGRTVVVTN